MKKKRRRIEDDATVRSVFRFVVVLGATVLEDYLVSYSGFVVVWVDCAIIDFILVCRCFLVCGVGFKPKELIFATNREWVCGCVRVGMKLMKVPRRTLKFQIKRNNISPARYLCTSPCFTFPYICYQPTMTTKLSRNITSSFLQRARHFFLLLGGVYVVLLALGTRPFVQRQ